MAYISLLFVVFLVFILLFRWKKRGIAPWWLLLSVEGETLKARYQDLNIHGRPDAIYKIIGTPYARIVEEKSRQKPKKCYLAYKLQATAYAYLLEQSSNLKVKKVRIQFANGGFTIKINKRLKNKLFQALEDIQDTLETGEALRNHKNKAKCAACQYISVCEQSLY